MTTWRLIPYEEFIPAFNMACDEAILEAHLRGEVPPTLRLYGWTPAAVSIGYAQKISANEVNSILEHGLAVVRRATGGRAVLHEGDLTYSFVGSSKPEDFSSNNPDVNSNTSDFNSDTPEFSNSQSEVANLVKPLQKVALAEDVRGQFLSSSVAGAYTEICQGLTNGFAQLELELQLGSSTANYRANYDCFRATTNADLQHKGKKLIGSAQLRRKNAVLQHGSILLNQGQNRIGSIFGDSKSQEINEERHANLFEILGRNVPIQELQEALRVGFGQAFSVNLEAGTLTNNERKQIEQLIPKYEVPS